MVRVSISETLCEVDTIKKEFHYVGVATMDNHNKWANQDKWFVSE